MPFTKKQKDGYHRSKKSGRKYSPAQLRLYYATNGFKNKRGKSQ